MNSFLTNLAAVGRRTDILERIETPAAAITLTRSASQVISGTSATITWQVETRNRGFIWSGTTVTIPTDGFYLFYFFGQVNTNQINFFDIVTTGSSYTNQSVRAPITNASATYYFTTGTTFTIVITNSVAGLTLNQNIRMDIIQITGAV